MTAPKEIRPPRATASFTGKVVGRYQVHEVVGKGAYSVVYRAHQPGMGREVALKVFRLHKQVATGSHAAETAIKRFKQEARIYDQLRHPNTVVLFDADQTSRGRNYMAFEFIHGPTLTEVIQDNADGMEPSRVIHIARQVAQSLHEAHGQGIIHRDLKPGNIMLMHHMDDPDFVKVLDFGIAKILEERDPEEADPNYIPDRSDETSLVDLTNVRGDGELTLDGKIVGTPRYVSPEAVLGDELTPAADIYSLGLLMHEMLSGVAANGGDSPESLIRWHLEDRPFSSPSGFNPPKGLKAVIRKATMRDANQRYQSARELVADLDELTDEGERESKPSVVLKWLLLINLFAMIVVGLGLALWFLVLRPEPEPVPAPTPPPVEMPAPPAPVEVEEVKEPPPPPPKPVLPQSADVSSTPPGAAVFVADKKIGVTPFEYVIPPDSESVEMVFKRRGYADLTLTWKAGEDSPFPVELERKWKGGKTKGKGGKGKKSKYYILD